MNQPRVERVRRALARDLDRTQAVAVVDMASLAIKLDEAVRLVDDLPLLAQAERRAAEAAAGGAAAPRPALAGSAASTAVRPPDAVLGRRAGPAGPTPGGNAWAAGSRSEARKPGYG